MKNWGSQWSPNLEIRSVHQIKITVDPPGVGYGLGVDEERESSKSTSHIRRRSYIPVFQIRIEKMREVKRPLL
ncbi:hypothetical protein GW17_00023706 [Ensete ventricosum]|nr:hypothetical protein GW17_00023706 [Ensete ventricosum]RZR98096.1 hypothetical protein BHM03_00027403 [Ensete ventricosum]